MKSILGIGNALVDILAFPTDDTLLQKYNLPKGGMVHIDEKLSVKIMNDLEKIGYQLVAGGSAANTLNGTASLGLKSGFIGKIGKDELGNFFRNDQLNNGVTPLLYTSDTSTGRALVIVSTDAERTFADNMGAALEFVPENLMEEDFDGYDYLHVEGYLAQNKALLERVFEIAKSKEMIVSIDMASYNVVDENRDFFDFILKNYVDILFANEEEARSFTGENPEEAAKKFADYCEIAVVKTGSKGSIVRKGTEIYRIPSIEAKVIDCTGAGDMYAAGFLYGLASNYPLIKCGELGTLCAQNIIEVVGPKMDKQRWAKIKQTIE